MPGGKQIEKEKKQNQELRTNANQNAEAEVQQNHVIRQEQAGQVQQNEVIRLEKFNQEKVVADDHKFDKLYNDIRGQILDDKMCPGGDMEASDYMDLQGSQILEKLQENDRKYKKEHYSHVVGYEEADRKDKFTFESFIFTEDLKKAMKNLDLTDTKKVNELKIQIQNSIENCEHITGPALKAMSDKFFKYAYTSANEYFATVNQDMRYLLRTLRFIGNRNVVAGAEETLDDGTIYKLKPADVQAAEGADEVVLGGKSALKEVQTVSTICLVDEEKHTAKEIKKGLGSLYGKSKEQLTEKERQELDKKIKNNKALTLKYQWDPSLMIYEAQKDPREKMPDKDGELVPRQLDLYKSQKDLMTFANTLTERMLLQIADYCTERYKLSKEPASMQLLVKNMKEQLGDSKDFAAIKSISGNIKTDRKDMIDVSGLDVSAFTESPAVQQMNSLCKFIRNYTDEVNEQTFYMGLKVNDRIAELQMMTDQSRKNVKGAFEALQQDVEQVLKNNFAEGEIPAAKNESELQKMEHELGALESKELDQPKYEMSYKNLYSICLQFRNSLNNTLSEREYEVVEKGKKVTKKKEVIDISTKTFTQLEASCKDIQLTMERILESYKKEKNIEGTLDDAMRGTGEQWKDLAEEPLWGAYKVIYSSFQNAVNVAGRFREDLEKHGAMKDQLISGYYANMKDVRKMLENCEKKLDASAMSQSVAAEYKRVMELQQEYSELRKSRGGADKAATEQDKINEGKKIYQALAKYDALRTELTGQKKEFLTKTPQGRKVLEMVNYLNLDYCQKLLDEKKEELAYYEGSLLKREMNFFTNQEQDKQQKAKSSQAERIADAAAAYKKIEGSLDAYLKRYGAIKESCYYVKEFELKKEHYIRRVKDESDAMVVSVCDQVAKEMDLENRLEKPVFNDQFGQMQRELDEAKQAEFTQEQANAYLDEWFYLTLASGSLDKAGMKTKDIMNNLGYRTGFLDDGYMINMPSKWKIKVPKKALRAWYIEKAAKLLPLCMEMEQKFREKTGNASETFNNIDFDMYFEDYLLRQTKLGAQVHVLVGMSYLLGLIGLGEEEEFGALAKLAEIDLRMDGSRQAAADRFHMEADNKELLDRQAVDTYRDLKVNNNLETRNEALRKRYFDKRDESDQNESPKISVAKALAQLKEKDKLITNNSQYFQDVIDAAELVEKYEKSKTASYKDMQAAYSDLNKKADIYIRKRDNWNHAVWKAGQQRLNAVKDLKEAIQPRFEMMEGFRVTDKAYEKNKEYITQQSQKLKAFQEEFKRQGGADRNYLIEFKEKFAKDLKAFDEDTLTNTRAGVDYMVALKNEEMKLSRLSTKYLLLKSEKLMEECLKSEPADLSKEKQYELWAKCYSFYSENKKTCPEEAKRSLETVEMLSRRFVDAGELKAIRDRIKEDEKDVDAYAQGKKTNVADMLRLKYKHAKFVKGVGEIELGSFVNGYEEFRNNIYMIESKTKDALNIKTAPGLMAEAQKIVDEKLDELRKKLEKHDFIGNAAGADVTEEIRDGLQEIAFLTDTFGFLKNVKKYEKDDPARETKADKYKALLDYYERQRQNLERVLASYAVRDVVIEDLGLNYKRDGKTDHTKKKGYGTISRVELADERHETMKMGGKRLEDLDYKSLEVYVEHIAMVEAEAKQLGGLKQLSMSQPEMANELRRQMAYREKFEAFLKTAENPEHQERVEQAIENMAVDYNKRLQKKLKTIANYHLESGQERMVCYVASLSKSFDEAQEFLKLVGTWESYGSLKASQSAMFVKLQETVNQINRQAAEGLKQDGFDVVAKQLKKRVQSLKTEDAMMRYSTEEVCRMRDANFGMTLRNLGSLKLSGVNDFHINEKVKAERVHYASQGYDKMKVNKSWSFKLFGYTIWGKDNYSLDDFISRLEKGADLYEDSFTMEMKRKNLKEGEKLKTPLRDLVSEMNTLKSMAERLATEPEKIPTSERNTLVLNFKNLIRKLNHKFNEACLMAVGLPKEEDIIIDKDGKWIDKSGNDIEKAHKQAVKQVKEWQKGWKDYYLVLNTLPEQVESFMDRLPHEKNQVENLSARTDHQSFVSCMKDLTQALAGDESDEAKEDQLVSALGFVRMCTNAYAESALEHNVNMESTTYSEYLSALTENKCFRHAQKALKQIEEIDPEDRLKDAGKIYVEHIRYISKYYLATGIGRDAFKQMKNNMDQRMRDMGLAELIVTKDKLRELQESVLKEIVGKIEIPEEKAGDQAAKLDAAVTEKYKELKELYGAVLMRALALDEVEETAINLEKTSKAYKEAAEKVNGKGWWRILRNMIGRIIPV